MTNDTNNVRRTLRDQAIARAIGELNAAMATYYGGDSDDCPLYEAITNAIESIEAEQ